MYSTPQTAVRVMEHKEPWTVNALAQAAAAVLEDRPFEEASIAAMRVEKSYLEAGLAEIGIDFVPSTANYYLLKVDRGCDVAAALEKRGILVRDCAKLCRALAGRTCVSPCGRAERTSGYLRRWRTICAHS